MPKHGNTQIEVYFCVFSQNNSASYLKNLSRITFWGVRDHFQVRKVLEGICAGRIFWVGGGGGPLPNPQGVGRDMYSTVHLRYFVLYRSAETCTALHRFAQIWGGVFNTEQKKKQLLITTASSRYCCWDLKSLQLYTIIITYIQHIARHWWLCGKCLLCKTGTQS